VRTLAWTDVALLSLHALCFAELAICRCTSVPKLGGHAPVLVSFSLQISRLHCSAKRRFQLGRPHHL